MDNIAHTLCAAALARARLVPKAPGVTAALLVGANLPDVDAWFYLTGDALGALEFRRGWTHSLVAFVLEIPLLALAVWLAVRRRAERGTFRALLWAAALGILSHLALDLLNTYGVRFLLPFTERWFHGDIAYIVDPWMWLLLGLGALPARGSVLGKLAWAVLTGLGVVLMLGRNLPPSWVAVWALAMGAGAWSSWALGAPRSPRLGLAACGVYLLAALGASRTAEGRARAFLAEVEGSAAPEVIVMNPGATRPWVWTAVVGLPDEVVRVALRAGPGFSFGEPKVVHRLPRHLDDPALERVRDTREYRVWRLFARVPFVRRDGPRLVLGDARYSYGAPGGFADIAVELPAEGSAGVSPAR